MNASKTWEIVERKMLELRILTNANWRNQEFELAVLGEKTLRSIEGARGYAESARLTMENLEGPELAGESSIEGELAETSTRQSLQF